MGSQVVPVAMFCRGISASFEARVRLLSSLDFDFVNSFAQLEMQVETVKESRLSEQSNADRIESCCKSGIDRKLSGTLQIDGDVHKMSRHVRASHARSHFDRGGERIKPERLQERT